MVKIVQSKNPILRKKAREVPLAEIGSLRINRIIRTMQQALREAPNGIALAAPQIGELVRIFVVSGKAFAERDEEGEAVTMLPDRVFINPEIKKMSKKKGVFDEGCLSIPNKYGKIKRAMQTTVAAYDEHGKKFEYGGSGLLSEIFQHEIDHLNGVLFIDTATKVQDVTPEHHEKEKRL